MSETVLIIATIGVIIIILVAIIRGQRIKKIQGPGGIVTTFQSGSNKITLHVKVPDHVAWLNLKLKLNGRKICQVKAKDRDGKEIVKDVAIKNEGTKNYSIEATGTQRLYNSNMQLTPVQYNASGSGNINIIYDGEYVIHQVADLVPGGTKFRLCLESYQDYDDGVLPDDLAEAEIDRLINES
jgi:hypothetical protein